MTSTKTRFAPSPTGLMHIGNARTALFSALFGDRFLLRIEDTDQERNRREFVAELIEDLHWMGLAWDEGPQTSTPDPEYFQSQRVPVYRHYYEELERCDLAYPCYCTQTELEISRKIQLGSGQPPRYSGKCARLSEEERQRFTEEGRFPTLRFRVSPHATVEFEDLVRGPQKFATSDIGDFIIRRADGSPAFFFCNAVDDSLMGVTHVVRGEDHLTNTPRQILILQALGLGVPRYAHCALILGDDGAPLSKRNGSRSINQLRMEGYFPLALLNMLARLGHHYECDDLMDLTALKSRFDLSHLGKSPARFDIAHLDYWQQQTIRTADNETLGQWLRPETRALVPEDRWVIFLDMVRSNCVFPDQADQWARIVFGDELQFQPDALAAAQTTGESFFLAALDAASSAGTEYEQFLSFLKAGTGARGKNLFMPLRAALTGRLDGPDLGTIYRVLDTHRLHRRLAEFSYASG